MWITSDTSTGHLFLGVTARIPSGPEAEAALGRTRDTPNASGTHKYFGLLDEFLDSRMNVFEAGQAVYPNVSFRGCLHYKRRKK